MNVLKKLNERRRLNKSWRKELRKIETSIARILSKDSRKNSFFDEYLISNIIKDDLSNDKNTIEIHSIAAILFNILSRQKNVEIFVVFIKDLQI